MDIPFEKKNRVGNPSGKLAVWRNAFHTVVGRGLRGELRLIAPVLNTWFVVFIAAILLSDAFPSVNVIEMFIAAHCAMGMFMTIAWTCFYGTVTWRRIVGGLLVVSVTATCGVILAWPHFDSGGDWAPFIYMPTFMTLIGLIPVWAVRRFWGWRIFHLRDAEVGFVRSFSILNALTWTAFMAVVFTASRLVFQFLNYEGNDFAEFLLMGIVIPAVIAVAFLNLLSRLETPWMLVVVPGLAVLSACLLTAASALTNKNASFESVMNELFWEVTVWFCVAGFVLTGVVWLLRRRGLVFSFGHKIDPDSFERLKRDYEASLKARVSLTERLLTLVERLLQRRKSALLSEVDELSSIEFPTKHD